MMLSRLTPLYCASLANKPTESHMSERPAASSAISTTTLSPELPEGTDFLERSNPESLCNEQGETKVETDPFKSEDSTPGIHEFPSRLELMNCLALASPTGRTGPYNGRAPLNQEGESK